MIAGTWYRSISRSTALRAASGVVADSTCSLTLRRPGRPWLWARSSAVRTPVSSSLPPLDCGPLSGYTAPMTSSSEAGEGPLKLLELLQPITARSTAKHARLSRYMGWTVIRPQHRGGGGHGARDPPPPTPPRRERLFLDWNTDRAAPLRPGAVVVADVGVAEELVENEPGVSGALTDAAVGDHFAVTGDSLAGVDLPQVGLVFEGAVLLYRGGPGDVGSGRDVAAALSAFLRQVLRSQQLARKLSRRTDVHKSCIADSLQDLVAVGAQFLSWLSGELVGGRLDLGHVCRVRAAFDLPLDTAAVHELNLVVAVVLHRPVGVGGEPVVVVAIEQDRGVRGDAGFAKFPGESVARSDVADGLVLQVLLPVPADGAFNVTGAVGSGIDVDLDEPEAWLAEVLGQPLSADQGIFGGRTD